jgi:UDP-N-acetylmuramoylalanine--D-glutamate ligase
LRRRGIEHAKDPVSRFNFESFMFGLQNKQVLVAGLGGSGVAATRLLLRRGAKVMAVDNARTPALKQQACDLEAAGATVKLGARVAPDGAFDLAVVSPGLDPRGEMMQDLSRRGIPVIGEFELGYQQSLCPNIAVTGTNGKTTTTELIERVLNHCGRKTVAAGNIGLPVCSVVDQTKELDFLTLEVSSFQLETIQFFRPSIAVFLNITPDHLDRYSGMADYLRAKARIFLNQQVFDWAIIQSEALAQMRSLNISIPSKIITFSASNRRADIFLDRTLLVSRMPEWPGPLLNMEHCQLRGPHNAENLMATLAIGRVLRLPFEPTVEALQSFRPAPHRLEPVAELNGVQFINDSKATNVDALHRALLSIPEAPGGHPNVWLIAGGKDKGFDYHDVGPLLSQRVKGAFLIGETREKIRAAWSLFTSCTMCESLDQAVRAAAKNAQPGDTVLLSPACSSFDQFKNYQHRGELFRQHVEALRPAAANGASGAPENTKEPTSCGCGKLHPKIKTLTQTEPVTSSA